MGETESGGNMDKGASRPLYLARQGRGAFWSLLLVWEGQAGRRPWSVPVSSFQTPSPPQDSPAAGELGRGAGTSLGALSEVCELSEQVGKEGLIRIQESVEPYWEPEASCTLSGP